MIIRNNGNKNWGEKEQTNERSAVSSAVTNILLHILPWLHTPEFIIIQNLSGSKGIRPVLAQFSNNTYASK